MHICVIKASMFGQRAKDALTPLLFAILKTLTPPDIRLTFLDENIEPVYDVVCDAAAISVDTFTARRSYALSLRFRKRGIPVILGGIHATLCPDEAAQHADAVVTGDAEDTWTDVINDLRAGKLKSLYKGMNKADLSETEFDYSVFKGKKYLPVGIVQFSRGCKFNCEFCSIHTLYQSKIRTRAAQVLTASLRQLPQKYLLFIDDNLYADPAQMDKLLIALEPLKRRWVCQISLDAAMDFKLLCRLRKSGCFMVIIGFESLAAENLGRMNKKVNLEADYRTVIENVRKAELMLYGTFVIGYDADTTETVSELMAFTEENCFAIANFNPLIPTPGTALYSRLKNEDRLLYEHWWNDPSYCYGDAVFYPNAMLPEQLAESCKRARYNFYSLRSIFTRLRRVNALGFNNLFIYLLINVVSGISIRHKQGRKLG